MSFRRLPALLLPLILLNCSNDAASADESSQPSAAVAAVEGDEITLDDLAIRGELVQLQQQIYQLKIQAVEEAIAERLLEKEAAERGVSYDELIEQEITAKTDKPTAEEVEQFYEQRKSQIPRSLDQVRTQIEDLLYEARQRERRRSLVEELRSGAEVTIYLSPPRLPVDLSQAPTRGPEDAPITIVEFSDFECPFCRRVQPTLAELQDRYGDKLRWSFKDLPLKAIHAEATTAAEAARCAGDQGKFWEFRAALFESNSVNDARYQQIASEIEIDAEQLASCIASDKHEAAVEADLAEAQSLGLTGTPAFLVNGVLITGAQPVSAFREVIDRELARGAAPASVDN